MIKFHAIDKKDFISYHLIVIYNSKTFSLVFVSKMLSNCKNGIIDHHVQFEIVNRL